MARLWTTTAYDHSLERSSDRSDYWLLRDSITFNASGDGEALLFSQRLTDATVTPNSTAIALGWIPRFGLLS
jgi:hypothetical protein